MKSFISVVIVFTVLLLTVPALPLVIGRYSPSQAREIIAKGKLMSMDSEPRKPGSSEVLKVFDITTGEVEEMPVLDYVVGAVAAALPAEFEKEALKAQAVAAYTYALRQKRKAETAPDKSLHGAYFSNDSSKYQAFFTESQQKHYYGENYEAYSEKIRECVRSVLGEYMSYNDEPIVAAFHSLSTGKTESAANIWDSDIPYLVSVDSKYDESAPKFLREQSFTEAEMKEALKAAFPDAALDDDPAKWFGKPEKSEAQTVLRQTVGNEEHSGQEIRAALKLCSASFDIEYSDGDFTVTTKGSGHGVGMSQFGANELAKSGKKYDEILKYYYYGIELKKNSE